MYTRKSRLVFFEQILSSGFELFLTKCSEGKLSLFLEEKLSPGVFGLALSYQKCNVCFVKKMLRGWRAIFLRLLGSHRRK